MQPKYRKARDEDYLNKQRNKPCLLCEQGEKSDPHHAFCSGGKHGNDYLAVSLCRGCHSRLHASKEKEEVYWHGLGYDVKDQIIHQLIDYIEELKEME